MGERKRGREEEEGVGRGCRKRKSKRGRGRAAVQFPLNFARTKVQAKAIEEAPSRHTPSLSPLSLSLPYPSDCNF